MKARRPVIERLLDEALVRLRVQARARRADVAVVVPVPVQSETEFRWASEAGAAGMAYPEELEYLGYERVRRHPFWPASWLMRRVSR